jgi:thiamine-monophosphate kinase
MLSSLSFPPLPEFDLVKSLLERSGNLPFPVAPRERGWIGPGDDCAQFDGWLATLDMSVEGTHFRLDWSSPEEAVEKCLLSNFSDVNAMGGTSRLALLGLCVNKSWSAEVRDRVARAFAEGCARRNVLLIGGDTVAGESGCFSVTVLGTTEHRPLRRSAARAGQDLYVSGALGRSAAGLWLLQNGNVAAGPWAQELLAAHRVPRVPLDLGPRLAALPGMGACVDVSDGLSSELHHLALQSGVRLQVDEMLLPVAGAVREFCAYSSLPERQFVLHGGEEYALLFACDPKESVILGSLPCEGGLHRIGTVLPGQGVELISLDGRVENLEAGAWSHL